jgi:hypothetical protein
MRTCEDRLSGGQERHSSLPAAHVDGLVHAAAVGVERVGLVAGAGGHVHGACVGAVAVGVDGLAALGPAALDLVVVLDQGAAVAAGGVEAVAARGAGDVVLFADALALRLDVAVSKLAESSPDTLTRRERGEALRFSPLAQWISVKTHRQPTGQARQHDLHSALLPS